MVPTGGPMANACVFLFGYGGGRGRSSPAAAGKADCRNDLALHAGYFGAKVDSIRLVAPNSERQPMAAAGGAVEIF